MMQQKGIRQPRCLCAICRPKTAPIGRLSSFIRIELSISPAPPPKTNLRRCLDLGEGLAHLVSLLLLNTEKLEALEVGEGFSAFCPLAALSPLAVLPFLVDLGLLPVLLQCAGSDRTGYVELDVGEEDIG